MGNTILQTIGLYKYFGNVVANEDINIKVSKASVHSIIGENGAGKSTLMNMIAGIYQPSKGDIFVDNNKVLLKNPNDASKYGIGMVHQEFMLFPELTVLENLILGYENSFIGIFLNKKKSKEEIEDICNKYNFSIPLDKKVENLPVSILQQVEIVKILYKGADIIILDEPTAVLTPQGIEGLFTAIRGLKEKGKTIILITHKLKEVMLISDYITVLKNGKVTGNLNTVDASEKKLANLMVGREVLFNTKKNKKEIGSDVLVVNNLSINNDDNIEKVNDVNFSVKKGEIVGIAGVAGSGQAELIETIFGLRHANSGNILYKNTYITKASTKMHRLLKIGYVPEDRLKTGSSSESNLVDNCIMGYHVSHRFKNRFLIDKKQSEDFTNSIISNFNVKTKDIYTNISTLSGGNIQKLVVGREFLQNNDLLIIEDPTRGIDVGSIEFIWQEIIKISETGTSILLISHELGEILELSDRILIMFNGKIVGDLQNTPNLDEKTVGLYMLGGYCD